MAEQSSFDRGKLEERLGYRFRDGKLLEAALTHSSASAGSVRHGEQLELVGDAVLGLAIAKLLLEAHPEADEGNLSKWRAVLVQASTLATKARELDIGSALLLGRGEERSGGRNKDSILACAYEAVLGAIFREVGFRRACAVVRRHFKKEIKKGFPPELKDWKTVLQERTQARLRTVPEYRLAEERGPAHAREFTSEVWIAGRCMARGSGTSKREAERRAAEAALELLESDEPVSR